MKRQGATADHAKLPVVVGGSAIVLLTASVLICVVGSAAVVSVLSKVCTSAIAAILALLALSSESSDKSASTSPSMNAARWATISLILLGTLWTVFGIRAENAVGVATEAQARKDADDEADRTIASVTQKMQGQFDEVSKDFRELEKNINECAAPANSSQAARSDIANRAATVKERAVGNLSKLRSSLNLLQVTRQR